MDVLSIADPVKHFCIELFQFKIAEPTLAPLQDYFFGSPIAQAQPVRLVISTDHLNFYTDNDFQLQLSITGTQFDLWCSVWSLKEQTGSSFYYHYHVGEADVLEGDLFRVGDWLDKRVEKGEMLSYLKIQHTLVWED